jgi:hypothetical protein
VPRLRQQREILGVLLPDAPELLLGAHRGSVGPAAALRNGRGGLTGRTPAGHTCCEYWNAGCDYRRPPVASQIVVANIFGCGFASWHNWRLVMSSRRPYTKPILAKREPIALITAVMKVVS